MSENQIKEMLLENSEDFRQIYLRHYDFQKELNKLNKINFKSSHEILKCKEIKRKKLLLKDQMQTYINAHKTEIEIK